jgi:phosphoribosylamine--glycine ligase
MWMNVLLIGSGGREHALAWKLRQSPQLGTLFCTPGNAGILSLARKAEVNPNDHAALVGFCRKESISLVVVGPEAPLVDGLADALREAEIAVLGPSREAAMLEASKSFTKTICAEYGIPTAAYAHFADRDQAIAYARKQGAPLVVKADGLAAGKGVLMCETLAEAENAISACFSGAFGAAGASIVIEEKLIGEEASFFAICDGIRAVPLASAQDYKRAFDGDLGPNTGGMGTVSPAPMMPASLQSSIMQKIVTPTLDAMAARGTPFQGILFAGLMITAEGPKLIEYNVRFGDPECQVLMLRLKSDLLPVLHAAAMGKLETVSLEWRDEAAMCVVMAAEGYPGPYGKGSAIRNLGEASQVPGATIFHAGTELKDDGTVVANGGRVLNVCALGRDIPEARAAIYKAIGRIDWPEGYCRSDIGWRSIDRENAA